MVDGKPRSYRDTRIDAIGAAELLKNRNPNSEVAVKDRQSGMMTVVLQARLMPTTQPVNGRYFGAKQW
ncbi:MAG TPA: hypothetical protein VK512_22080 [Xanthobacteraceae bacterium]|nr:hypothetical protein [Xanthobacteraceae bacterium]